MLKNTERQIQKPAQHSIDRKQWDKAIDRVNKLEDRFTSQQKQQNKMRSALDKLRHNFKNWQESDRQPQSYTKNFIHIAKPTKITSQLIARQPTTHVYIDGNNFKCSAYKLNLSVDYRALKSYLMPENSKIRLNFYDGRCQPAKLDRTRFHRYLERLGYQVTSLPKRIHQDGTEKTIGDDTSIVIDILDKVRTGDRLILISGDGDFFPVIQKIQQRQVKVTAISWAMSTSELILEKVNEFIDLEDIKPLIATDDSSDAA